MFQNINSILWLLATIALLISGIYFTFRLGFLQFNLKKMVNGFKSKTKNGLTPFQTLMVSLAGRIGVGSIAGVALAIYAGGIGSIFWMWLIAIIGAANAYAETVLGSKYKEKDEDEFYKSGPSYYIKNGLKNKGLGAIYAITIIISYAIGFIGIQANTMTKAITTNTSLNPYIIATVIAIITIVIIFGGLKKIASVSSKIVPIMTILYIGAALYVLITNITIIPSIFGAILKEAFNLKPFVGGFLGMVLMGIQRGIFSNESGIGTGSITGAISNSNNPSSQGYIQMLGVYITTFLICMATAIVILTTDYANLVLTDVNGIEITTYAFNYHLGEFGNLIVIISILLFAFSTILSGYYYGESSLKYFFNKIDNKYLTILKICTIIVIFIGSVISSTMMWQFVDITVAILAIINTYSLLRLRKEVIMIKERDYVIGVV